MMVKSSQHKKVNNSQDSDDDDDDEMEKDEDESDEDSEAAASDSEGDELASEVDDVDDDNDDDDIAQSSCAAAKTAVRSPAEGRKRRLEQLEDFVKSQSESNVKGTLKRSASSDASRVKFASDEKVDGDRDSRPVYREDIYGRLRDERGNVVNPDDVGVTSGQVGAYVPPGKRQKLAEESGSCGIDKSTDESKQRVEKLTRQVKGQINRLDIIYL